MWLFAVTTFILLVETTYGQSYGKCCDNGQILQEYENSSYQCIEDTTLRNGILTVNLKVLQTNDHTKCIEYSTGFYEFEILDEKIIQKNELTGPIFTKCCPLGYIYDPTKHSCYSKNSFNHTFIKETLVRVGLPLCSLVVDVPLQHLDGDKPEGEYCEDETSVGFIRRECRTNYSVCDEERCVKKCCPDGKSFVNGANCLDTYTNGLDLSFSNRIENPEDPFAIIHNETKCPGKFYLMSEARYIFTLLKNGELKYWKNLTNSFITESPTNSTGYCLEYSLRPGSTGYFFFNCLINPASKQKFQYTKWPKILSCVFLSLTIAIYILLQQTKKLFGKILMNYCVSTLCLFAMLTYAQVDLDQNNNLCRIVGFFLVFFATASFAFLNVMCFDIWLTFGSTKNSVGVYQRRKDLKKILLYMLYGWGMPLLLTIMIYILSITESLPDYIRPYVGIGSCFISLMPGNYALVVFLRLPHFLIQIVNLVLFVKTILYCLKIKNEIERINDTKNEKRMNFNRDKEKLFLILKLAVIMGITFVIDTVSSFVPMNDLGTFWRTFEVVIDCFNCLQGFYIFIIFICKRTIYNDFLKMLHIKRRDTYMNNTESFTSTTRISLNGKNSIKK